MLGAFDFLDFFEAWSIFGSPRKTSNMLLLMVTFHFEQRTKGLSWLVATYPVGWGFFNDTSDIDNLRLRLHEKPGSLSCGGLAALRLLDLVDQGRRWCLNISPMGSGTVFDEASQHGKPTGRNAELNALTPWSLQKCCKKGTWTGSGSDCFRIWNWSISISNHKKMGFRKQLMKVQQRTTGTFYLSKTVFQATLKCDRWIFMVFADFII